MITPIPQDIHKAFVADIKQTPHRDALIAARLVRLCSARVSSKYSFSKFLNAAYGTNSLPTIGKTHSVLAEEYWAWKEDKPEEDLITDFGKILFAWWEKEEKALSRYFINLMFLYQDHLTRKVQEGHNLIKAGTLVLPWNFEEIIRLRDHIENLSGILYTTGSSEAGMWGIDCKLAAQENWIDIGLWALLKNQGVQISTYNNVYYRHLDDGYSHWWNLNLSDTPPFEEEEIVQINKDQKLSDFLL